MGRGGLRGASLSYREVLAQSVAVIAPSTVPAAIVGLVYASAGNGSWLSFLLGMFGLVFVSLNINQFARRSASAGSLYTYIVQGLGPTAGVLSGWSLLFAYLLTGMSTLCGFVFTAAQLLSPLHLHAPTFLLLVLGLVPAAAIAYRDITLSTRLMLYLEGVSLLLVLLLGVLVWRAHQFALDLDQLRLVHASPGAITAGIVLVVFGFSGFESSSSLGDEAKRPLVTIPRAILQSVLVCGVIFAFMAYVVVLGFKGSEVGLDKSDAPLVFLAARIHLAPLGYVINLGVLLSFFSCTLATINSTARILFAMSRHGLFTDVLGEAHRINETPHVAVAFTSALTLLVPATFFAAGVGPLDSQGYLGTLSSFGFLLVYILISIAAPLYLRRIRELGPSAIAFGILGTGFMILPFIGTIGIPGSSAFPTPSYPNNILILSFALYMLGGIGWIWCYRSRLGRVRGLLMPTSVGGSLPASID